MMLGLVMLSEVMDNDLESKEHPNASSNYPYYAVTRCLGES